MERKLQFLVYITNQPCGEKPGYTQMHVLAHHPFSHLAQKRLTKLREVSSWLSFQLTP